MSLLPNSGVMGMHSYVCPFYTGAGGFIFRSLRKYSYPLSHLWGPKVWIIFLPCPDFPQWWGWLVFLFSYLSLSPMRLCSVRGRDPNVLSEGWASVWRGWSLEFCLIYTKNFSLIFFKCKYYFCTTQQIHTHPTYYIFFISCDFSLSHSSVDGHRLFLHLDYCKECCHEHGSSEMSLRNWFPPLWACTQKYHSQIKY